MSPEEYKRIECINRRIYDFNNASGIIPDYKIKITREPISDDLTGDTICLDDSIPQSKIEVDNKDN